MHSSGKGEMQGLEWGHLLSGTAEPVVWVFLSPSIIVNGKAGVEGFHGLQLRRV